ncbi:MAG: flavodoxin [Frankiales bacterium]|nr:flavodoxin [Frankiales bacterium]
MLNTPLPLRVDGGQTAGMPTLLVVHHTPSPATQALLEAVLSGAADPELAQVEVVTRAALTAGAADLLGADGVVLGTPANIGSMSGALKHFFDTVYYPTLQEKSGLPYGLYVHGGDDTTGAVRAVSRITSGLSWREVTDPVTVTGAPDRAALDRCRELGATVAANLLA